MPPRLYKRHCSTCGISHTKPTGRKCTRSTMATDTNALATSTITGGHVLNSASMSSSLASLTSVAPTTVGSPLSLTTPRPSLGTLTSTTTSLTFSSSSLLTPSRPGPLSSTVSFRLPAPLMSTHTSTPPPYHPLIQTPQPSADQLALHSTLQVVTSMLDQISLRMTNMENREAQRQASQVGSPPAATAVRTAEGATGGRPAGDLRLLIPPTLGSPHWCKSSCSAWGWNAAVIQRTKGTAPQYHTVSAINWNLGGAGQPRTL